MPVQTLRNSNGTVEAIDALRARIAKIEGHTQSLNGDVKTKVWTSGLVELDAALGGSFGLGALHEIMPASPVDVPVASAFAFGLLARLPRHGPVLWCINNLGSAEHGAPYMPGLAAFGINPARIINIKVRHPRDLSFVLEEAAKLPSLAAIIAEGPPPSFTGSRRLALLLATSNVPMLFLVDGKISQGSAAETRVVVSPVSAPGSDVDAPGPPAFNIILARNRNGRPGVSFQTVFDHAKLCFSPIRSASLSGAASDSIPDRQFSVDDAQPRHQRA